MRFSNLYTNKFHKGYLTPRKLGNNDLSQLQNNLVDPVNTVF